MSNGGTGATVNATRSAIGEYLNIFLPGCQSNEISIPHTHAVGEMQIALVRKHLNNLPHQLQFGEIFLREILLKRSQSPAFFYLPELVKIILLLILEGYGS